MSFLNLRRARAFGAALLALCALVAPSVAAAQAEVASRPLDASERARLADGRLVVRPTTQRRGSLDLVGGVSYQVVNAPAGEVWTELARPSEWRRMLPQVSESRQVAASGDTRTIFLRQAQGPVSASYYLTATYAPGSHDLTFVLDGNRENDIRAAWGFISVRAWGTDKALVSYGAMLDLGDGLLTSMVRGTVHEWLLRVPSTIKQHLERRRRDQYALRR